MADSENPLQAPSPPTADETSTPEFLSLFLAEERRVYCYIVTLLGSPQDAEDLLQETVGVLWKKFGEFKRGTSFFAWASQTAHFLVCNHRRRKKHLLSVLDDEVLDQLAEVPADEQEMLGIRRAALYECLNKLSPKDRTLFERRYASSTKGRDLAADLGRSADSVYRSLGRIRRALLECVRRVLSASDHRGGS